MKLPINWLKEFVRVDIPVEKLADKITMTGLEVDAIESSVNFTGVVVGEVLERVKHPDADKLNVAKVRIGDSKFGEGTLQIVCGAPNLNVGQKVPIALIGAKIGDFEITKATLRGIDSYGMICSEKELGLGENHSGIMVLDKKAKVGSDFTEYIKTEKIIDLKVFANRPDMMSIVGLAREVSAAINKKLNLPKINFAETKEKTADLVEVTVRNKKLCPRYVARVIRDVEIKESPGWMKERLVACGIRPINNLVDISNYVMLEYGQPLHFFDLAKVAGKNKKAKIIVRTAEKDEKIITLDSINRKLTNEMLVIANDEKAIALAGVMGGENSEVDEKTKDILIEAAVFDKANIRRTSRELGLRSEAVARFEKGLPLALPEVAIDRASELLADLASGEITNGRVDVLKEEAKQAQINLNVGKVNSFLGTSLKPIEVKEVLDKLGFSVTGNGDSLVVVSPWWRPDVISETDLYEEVARIWGYEKISSTLPETGGRVPEVNKRMVFLSKVRSLLAGIGLTEILSYSFIGKKELEWVGEDVSKAPKVANPLVSEQEYLRTTLIPSMLTALAENQFNKETIKLFETGNIFTARSGKALPKEERMLSVGVIGGESWPIRYKDGSDFYDLKGVALRLLEGLGLKQEISLKSLKTSPVFEEGRVAEIIVSGKSVGYLGEVKKSVLDRFGLKKMAAVGYFNLGLINDLGDTKNCFVEFSKYPKVVRDLSVVLEKGIEIEKLTKAVLAGSLLANKVEVIDIYEGKPLLPSQKSVTVRVSFQSFEKTLTDGEIEPETKRIIDKISLLGGKIRSEEK